MYSTGKEYMHYISTELKVRMGMRLLMNGWEGEPGNETFDERVCVNETIDEWLGGRAWE